MLDVYVIFERKSYTWDGQRWYGTDDHMMPPRSMLCKLNAMLPAPAEKKAKPIRARRA